MARRVRTSRKARPVAVLVSLLLLAGGLQLITVPGASTVHAAVASRIDRLIYPTFGYPQMVKAGETFTLEFDFRSDDPAAVLPASVSGWQAGISGSNAYTPYETELTVGSVSLGNSTHWPAGSGRSVYEVYLMSVTVPQGTPPDLYDLTVSVTADGSPLTDGQPHAVCVVDGWKEDYKVIQWTDVHVHDVQYGVAGFESTAWTDRHLHDAVYLQKAVEVINTLDPDFLVLTGDTVFGQRYLPDQWPPEDGNTRYGDTEYEYEYDWCYQELQALEVPVFMQIGNHDGYYDTQDDGYDWWTETYGPLYYSFDYGDHHYTAANSFDWPREDREMEEFFTWLTGVLNPVSWQGQLRGGGDAPGDANAPDPAGYTDQLGWIRDDLAAHQSSGFRTLLMHHDPTVPGMWQEKDYVIVTLGKNGAGRLAALRLCADYRVGLVLSGHDHIDQYHEQPWTSGGGMTVFPNSTSLCIQKDGENDFYPGFKMPEFNGDTLVSHSYMQIGEIHYSYPYYRESNVGSPTDLTTLDKTAIERLFSNGGDWSGGLTSVHCDLANNLNKDFQDCSLEFYMPDMGPDTYYAATGGRVVGMSQPEKGRLNYRLDFSLPAFSGLTVSLDLESDTGAPSGSVSIEGGAARTDSLDVTLQLEAADDRSGVRDMMISNRADFLGACWEPFSGTRAWRLDEGAEGYRTVYVRFRDFCYPGHVSGVAYDSIVYTGGTEPWRFRWYFAEGHTGTGFDEYLCILNPSTEPAGVRLTYMPEGAGNIVRDLVIPGLSRSTVYVNNDAGRGLNLSALLESDSEVMAERAMYFAYGGSWTGGHCVMGARSAETSLYFAEGYTGSWFEEWLTIQNPGDEAAQVDITYMMNNGNNYGSSYTVPARSRSTILVNQDCPEAGDVSMRLESSAPVIAERPMYFAYGGSWTGGHCVMGARSAETSLYFAEGYTGSWFEEWLTIQNPGDEAAQVDITYMMNNGNNYEVTHDVPARSRYTVLVNRDCPEAGDVSMRLESSAPVIAERPMYFAYGGSWTGGHCVMGVTAVDMCWYFAEGYTGSWFEEWLTIQNPGDEAAQVGITYMMNNGNNYEVTHDVPARSRYTVLVNRDCPEAGDVSMRLESSAPVIAERPMYFAYGGSWTGGHCVTAFSKR